ncbi:MAG TPA: tetratricopeptide repeat protein [Bryobacteraceae bacterium]|jgi:tetratricopeptide (TPR) repeat protein|nr:tetratricopeptide repeat protein [Bryobacteraceae bacterium]
MKPLLFPTLFFLMLTSASAQVSMLSGKIAMADGSQPPNRVAIQRDCGGAPQTATFTDRNGHFTFPWNQSTELTADASEPISNGGPRGPDQAVTTARGLGAAGAETMSGCFLRATAPGYRSDSIPLDDHRASFENYDLGTIVLHPVENAGRQSVSATALKAPGDARKAYEKGLEALGKGKSADAAKDFEKAVGIYPQYADAWLALGKLRLQMKEDDSAGQAFAKAIEADNKLAEAHAFLGMLDVGKQKWADGVKELDAAVQLDPAHFPDAWFNDAVADYNLKNYDGAEKSAREALKLDPQHRNPQADYLLGLVLAAKKDYSGAAEQLRVYLRVAPDGPDAARARTQIVELEKMRDSSPR